MKNQDRHLAFVEHLEELRTRIIKSVVFLLIASGFFYKYVDQLIPVLLRPVGHLIYTSPAEAFVVKMKLTVLGGLFVSLPFILYQIWQFVQTGLTPAERKYSLFFVPFSFILFVLGAGFGLWVVLPIAMKFLASFSSSYILPMITVDNYLSFAGTFLLGFGLIFELPLVIIVLTKLGIVTPVFLIQKRRYAVVLIFIVSAILTPPDCISQLLMALPLLVLYELGILFSKITNRPSIQ